MNAVEKTDRILVTGGAGFLGSFVVERLKEQGYDNVEVVRRRDFDLTREADAERVYREVKPAVVMHLAAEVGGFGANRDNPGRFFFANMAMGMNLIEGARRFGIEVRAGRDDLRLPEVHAGPVQRGRAVERLPGRDQRAVRRGEEGAAG